MQIFYVFFLSCVCYAFLRVCLFVLCGHMLGKGCLLGSRLRCLTVNLSLSHRYPGSGVVLDLSIPDLSALLTITMRIHQNLCKTAALKKPDNKFSRPNIA